MPTGRFSLCACAVNNKIYAIGGYGGGNQLDVVEEYDPATDAWTTKTSMPTARSRIHAHAVAGKIYVFGSNQTIEKYDPATDAWTTKTQMPSERNNTASALLDNKIYVVGGIPFTSRQDLDITEEYNPLIDK